MKAPERDDLLLSGLIKPSTEALQFDYVGQPATFHSFVDWAKSASFLPVNPRRRFLEGSFIFEFRGRKHKELLETPEACVQRLQLA